MSIFDLNDYIKGDKTLDYQSLYKSMEEMTGFMVKQRREQHYAYVVERFNDRSNDELLHNVENSVNADEVPF